MPTITLTFTSDPHSTGAQVGDIAYYISNSNISSTGGFDTSSSLNNVVRIGNITGITSSTVLVNSTLNIDLPNQDDFIFFTKDNAVNLKSLIGYYANVKFINDSTDYAELFSVGLDVAESSK